VAIGHYTNRPISQGKSTLQDTKYRPHPMQAWACITCSMVSHVSTPNTTGVPAGNSQQAVVNSQGLDQELCTSASLYRLCECYQHVLQACWSFRARSGLHPNNYTIPGLCLQPQGAYTTAAASKLHTEYNVTYFLSRCISIYPMLG
jgi:hypothetical protein